MGSLFSSHSVVYSGRFQLAIDELNYHSALLTHGVSQDKAGDTFQDADKYSDPHLFADDDLVARLINDENVIWKQLLANPFCTKIKSAKKGDTKVETAFQTYMTQDFLYCQRVLLYHTERSIKAPDQAEYKNLTDKISRNAQYSYDMLNTCTGKLGLRDTTVLRTPLATATTDYINFVLDIAASGKYNWVESLVAIVPCVQSYHRLAVDIEVAGPDKTALWYENWVKSNLSDKSATNQIEFFKEHPDDWQPRYAQLRKIFHDACQKEINLWALATPLE